MKESLTEMIIYREATVEQMKLKIKSVIQNKRKQKTPNQNRQKNKNKNEDGVRSLWDNFRHTNICTMGVLEGEEREHEIESLFTKIMTEN